LAVLVFRGSGKSCASHGNLTIYFGRDEDRTIEFAEDLKLRDLGKRDERRRNRRRFSRAQLGNGAPVMFQVFQNRS